MLFRSLGLPRQLLQGRSRGAEQQTIKHFLMGQGQRAQFCRQGKGQEVVATGQEALLLLRQPALGLLAVAFGTMPVAARVIAVVRVSTLITRIQLASQRRGATTQNILDGLVLTGAKGMAGAISRGVEAALRFFIN